MRLAEQWKIQTVNQALAYRKYATNESELKKICIQKIKNMDCWS